MFCCGTFALRRTAATVVLCCTVAVGQPLQTSTAIGVLLAACHSCAYSAKCDVAYLTIDILLVCACTCAVVPAVRAVRA
jgi:hypothetical protein